MALVDECLSRAARLDGGLEDFPQVPLAAPPAVISLAKISVD